MALALVPHLAPRPRHSPMHPRCFWSGARDERAEPIELPAAVVRPSHRSGLVRHVLPEHRPALEAYAARVQRHGTRMLVTVLALTVASVAAPLALPEPLGVRALGGILVLLGVAIARDPFCTPETLEWFGVRSSLRVARIAAWVTGLIGLGLLALALA